MPPDTPTRLHVATDADAFLAAMVECDRSNPRALVGQACGIATRTGLWVMCEKHTQELKAVMGL